MIQCYVQGAKISGCGKYRYDLRRFWGKAPFCLWIMLNPSTADANVNDRTINKIMGFSQHWGYGGLIVVNLFAFRATDPDEMLLAADPIGPMNDHYILGWACHQQVKSIFVGWGEYGGHRDRGRQVGKLLESSGRKLHCLVANWSGHPRHPLYVAGNTEPRVWTPNQIREV